MASCVHTSLGTGVEIPEAFSFWQVTRRVWTPPPQLRVQADQEVTIHLGRGRRISAKGQALSRGTMPNTLRKGAPQHPPVLTTQQLIAGLCLFTEYTWGSRLKMGPPPRPDIYMKSSLEPVNVTLFGQTVFPDIVKDLAMSLSCIIWLGIKYHHVFL